MVRNVLRDRFVDDVGGEIKRVALGQLATGGPAALSVNAIGRQLGVSGPALYRYVAGRDALLTALIVDAYDDLAAATETAVAVRRTPRTRLTAFGAAYRQWARAEPHRYRLLFRAPLPGYDPNSAQLVQASHRTMVVLLGALDEAMVDRPTPGRRAEAGLRAEILRWLRRRGLPERQVDVARVALLAWTRLHGLASLEIEGGFTSMGIDPSPLYSAALADLLP